MQVIGRTLLLLTVAALAALASRAWLGHGPERAEPLRVGVLVWPPYEFAFLAADLGEYDDLTVELVDYRSPAEALRAYRSGMIDAVALTIDYLVQLVDHDPGHRAIYVIDFSNGGDALVARHGIDSLAQLAGQRIGVEASALGAYMLSRALDHAGLRPQDVNCIPIDTADQGEAFLSERVDAVITYEPTRSRLAASGGHVLFDSSDIPGEIVDVVICHRDLLDQRRADVRAFLRGWVRAVENYRADPQDAAERLAARESTTPEQFLQSLEFSVIPTRSENVALLSAPDSPLLTAMQRSAEVLRAMGLVDSPPIGPELLDASILREVSR